MSMRPRRVVFTTPTLVNAAGTFIGTFGGDASSPVLGSIRRLIARWEGSNMNTLRIVLQSRRHGTAITAATVPAEARLYDSGDLGAADSSATEPIFPPVELDPPTEFCDGFDVLATYSVGATGGVLRIAVDIDERE